ncbi:hypothetical protein RGQ21_10410 [Kitasatospora aureofaciens]|nr:hypothetical protein RGQ21_10410 [Kitasatospora aureofaciens]
MQRDEVTGHLDGVLGAGGDRQPVPYAEPRPSFRHVDAPHVRHSLVSWGPYPLAGQRGSLRAERAAPAAEPGCFDGVGSGTVRAMSSPESDRVGAFGHPVSPLNH